MSRLIIGDFAAFFEAVNGHPPFPWQVRLLHKVLADGEWPAVIDAPTGSGKTAVVEVHVFANALAALDGALPRVPRRLVVTVDRRALVDDNYEKARTLASALADGRRASDVIGTVANALAGMRPEVPSGLSRTDEPGPLGVARLRGGVLLGRDWLDDPAGCQVIAATPDMWGSRILFGGYGATPYARPREAGLLAFDTALVVDEAHLNRQLIVTAHRVSSFVRTEAQNLGVPPLQITEMSATSGELDGAVGVVPTDLEDGSSELLRSRLLAKKPVRLHATAAAPAMTKADRKRLVDEYVGCVLDLLGEVDGTVGCIVNTVALASEVAAALASAQVPTSADRPTAGSAPRIETIVGRMRPHDLRLVRDSHPGLFRLGGTAELDVVVATQTLEVGVDMDLAGVVSELAPGTSLTQRAGRVNRSGMRDSTPVVVVVPADPALLEKSKGPYDPDDLRSALAWLETLAEHGVPLSPWNVHPRGSGFTPPGRHPRRPAYHRPERWNIDFWSRTSESRFAEPDYELWLDDDLSPDLMAGLVVRQGLPNRPTEAATQTEAAPPAPHEVFPVPMGILREVMSALAETFDDGTPRYLVARNGDYLTSSADEPIRLRPGDVVIVDARAPFFLRRVVSAEGTEVSTDVADEWSVSVPNRRRAVRVGLGTPVLSGVPGVESLLTALRAATEAAADAGELAGPTLAGILEDWLERSNSTPGNSAARDTLRELLTDRNTLSITTAPIGLDSPQDFWLVIAGAGRIEADDELRQVATPKPAPVDLGAHAEAVADEAAALAAAIGATDRVIQALREAGALHDEGKSDPRFQRLLRHHAGAHEGRVLAKSGIRSRQLMARARAASGLPPRWRHEQLSAAIAWERLESTGDEHRDLVVRLVGTSHGRGRSSFDDDRRRLLGAADIGAHGAQELFDAGEWESLIERTDRTWGVWGCAYLEAVLRAADCTTSRRGS